MKKSYNSNYHQFLYSNDKLQTCITFINNNDIVDQWTGYLFVNDLWNGHKSYLSNNWSVLSNWNFDQISLKTWIVSATITFIFQHRKLDDPPGSDEDSLDGAPRPLEGAPGSLGGDMVAAPAAPKWVAVVNPDGKVREIKERRVLEHQVTDERKETEERQHYGDITDEVGICSCFLIDDESGPQGFSTPRRPALPGEPMTPKFLA